MGLAGAVRGACVATMRKLLVRPSPHASEKPRVRTRLRYPQNKRDMKDGAEEPAAEPQ